VHRPDRRRPFGLILAASAAFFALSCSSGPKLYPVKGKVFHGDTPAEGATVVFHLKGAPANSPTPSGTVGADGSFVLSTYPQGEGAPPGDYVVLVTWFPPNARELENAKNKLPERYGTAASPLTATVRAESNELEPFRIPVSK
jgi:hypothetical protein